MCLHHKETSWTVRVHHLSRTFLPSLSYGPHKSLCACVLSHFSRVRLFVTPWIVAREAPLSMGFPRPEYWNGLPLSSPGDPPHPEIDPRSHSLLDRQADSLPPVPPGKFMRYA